MTRGKFITFEGGEGSGKSTQIALLSTWLTAAGIDVLPTREPGGSPGAEEIRSLLVTGAADRWDPLSEALLHFTARRDHLRHKILPALDAGTWVVCDRYVDSTMAYQGYGHGLGREVIQKVYDLALGDLESARTKPDLTLILDIPVAEGLARAQGRADAEDRYESLGTAFHERLRAGFHEIAQHEPDRCQLIEASGSEPAVAAAVQQALRGRGWEGLV